MIRIFQHMISTNAFIVAAIEFFLLSIFIHQSIDTYLYVEHKNILLISLCTSSIIILFFSSLGLYNRDITTNRKIMAVRFLFAIGFLILITGLINKIIFHISNGLLYFPSFILMARVFLIGFFLFLIRIIYIQTIAEKFLRKVLVIGSGEKAARLAELFEISSIHSLKFVGFIGIKDEEQKLSPILALERKEFTTERLNTLFYQLRAEEIVFTPDEKRGISLESFVYLKLKGYKIYDFQSFVEQEKGRVEVDHLKLSDFVFTEGFEFGPLQYACKRIFDLAISILLCIFTAPILLIAMICIKIESPGPCLFSQERVGFEKKTFLLYKLRSMVTDAEKTGPKWASVNDQRITKIGKFIRKTRIDELPQLWNVIKGDMSFVGPRPERPVFVNDLAKKIKFYHERHTIKPGITGWAQINYPYGASLEDAKEKLCYDLYYVKNQSLFLDLTILVQTVRVILWPHGVR